MLVALELSRNRGWLNPEAEELIRRLEPKQPRHIEQRQLLSALTRDKKNRAGRNVFILLRGMGRPQRVADVTDQELRSTLTKLKLGRWPVR